MGEAVEHFSYDLVGNRLTDDKTTGNWDYNKNNELQSFDTTSFKYNLNGQMTEKNVDGTKTYYSYNLDGRLKEIKDNSNQVVAKYEYDPFGRRISKTLSQESKVIYFLYSDEGLVAEYNGIGQLIQSYGYKPDSDFTTNPVFTHRSDFIEAKGYAYYINDHLGTPQKLITNTGRKVWEATEDGFGKTVITNNEFRNPLRFPGQYEDNEFDLRYNWNRFYNVQLGQYISSDPIGLDGGINTYEYTLSNPLKFTDNDGLIPAQSIQDAIDLLIGEAQRLGGDPQGWVKRLTRASPKKYKCRYFISVNPPDSCPAPRCPIFATGEGSGKNIKEAYQKAFKEAHDKIPEGCKHQHHGQSWCRKGNQKPFFYK